MAVNPGPVRRFAQTIGAVRTGIILLIIVGIVSAAGTVILQRPLTSPDDMQRMYSPQSLRVLDATGMTDVYHAWWYLVLLGMLAISIIFASLERFPNAWRYYSRPYRRTDPSFRAVLPLHQTFPIGDPAQALDITDRVWKKHGLKPERIVEHDEVSLYAEKSRFAVMAVYVVHASLLLIMLGGIVDGIWGFKGYISLVAGSPALSQIEVRDGSVRQLPFAIRCDGAGQENYTGQYAMMPKRWWSKLAVLENGREVERKEIAVNDPLVYRGVRFYQSSYGMSGEMRTARFAVLPAQSTDPSDRFKLAVNETATLKDGSTLKLVKFFADAFPMDGELYQRSKDLNNAAIKLEVAKNGKTQSMYLFRSEQAAMNELTLVGPYDAQGQPITTAPFRMMALLDMAPFTGLQVSHEPGQWAVWAGCMLMGLGLILAFWVLHQRYWAVAAKNKEGRLVLWVGAASNKKREAFDIRFTELTADLEKELKTQEETVEMSMAHS